jgi:hypothetical protein
MGFTLKDSGSFYECTNGTIDALFYSEIAKTGIHIRRTIAINDIMYSESQFSIEHSESN